MLSNLSMTIKKILGSNNSIRNTYIYIVYTSSVTDNNWVYANIGTKKINSEKNKLSH